MLEGDHNVLSITSAAFRPRLIKALLDSSSLTIKWPRLEEGRNRGPFIFPWLKLIELINIAGAVVGVSQVISINITSR